MTNTRLLAVIVVYKMLPIDSPALKTLLYAAGEIKQNGIDLSILLRDNTPGGQAISNFPVMLRYEAAPHNPGLADAYNRALQIANTEGYDWLLTLDQDTLLPANFLRGLSRVIREVQSSPDIAAIVPQVTGDGRNISPFRLALGAFPRRFPYGYIGVPSSPTYAINSAATLRVSAVLGIGGYDPVFPLDISDLNLFHRLSLSGKSVYIAGSMLIHHDFSLLKKHRRMSVQRYYSLLLDECAFWDINMGMIARFERLFRLAGRACKDLFATDESAFQKLTLSEIKRRLLTRRSRRIRDWRKWAQARMAVSSPTDSADCKIHD